jgi:hypothetical protein
MKEKKRKEKKKALIYEDKWAWYFVFESRI